MMVMVMMVPAPPVPAMVVVVMMVTPMPAHFGRHLLPRVLLHRRCRARIDQRRRLRALGRRRDDEQCADSRNAQHSKTQSFTTQNFRSVHPILLTCGFTSAPRGVPDGNGLAAT
jgi:hypothetical protein